MTRREFLPLVAGTFCCGAAAGAAPHLLRDEHCEVVLADTGQPSSLRIGTTELVRSDLGSPALGLRGRKTGFCREPLSIRKDGGRWVFEYAVEVPDPLFVSLSAELINLGDASVLQQDIEIRGKQQLGYDLLVQLPRTLQLPHQERQAFLPTKQGIGRRKMIRGLDNEDDYVYPLAGESGGQAKPQWLAWPLVDEFFAAGALRLSTFTDPLFTSLIRLPYGTGAGQVQWIYPAATGLENGVEHRTIFTLPHARGPEFAIEAFYRLALAGVRAGPEWTHDIAMVDYDYLSKNGAGWFADIERLEQLIAPADRSKVLLALHAWYDAVGRYSFDVSRGRLDTEWVALPASREPRIQALGEDDQSGLLPTFVQTPGYRWPKASVRALSPVRMSIAEVHRRIAYAKRRGFRVILYFADGLASCDGLRDIYDPAKVLQWGGWTGPDMKGRAYTQNPLHPEVRAFFKNYLTALLDEYGREIDGLVWDETSTVRLGATGPAGHPGYADRAMMTLARELGAMAAARGSLALFGSDNIGFRGDVSMAPYALMLHGNFQDSHCRPEAWPYSFFPSLRNVSWSCNWAPVSNFEFMEFAVRSFDAPVAISNGAFGDDKGISELNREETERVMTLFEWRKQRRQQLHWVEEADGQYRYGARRIDNRYRIFE